MSSQAALEYNAQLTGHCALTFAMRTRRDCALSFMPLPDTVEEMAELIRTDGSSVSSSLPTTGPASC